jgi:hypothetical protein
MSKMRRFSVAAILYLSLGTPLAILGAAPPGLTEAQKTLETEPEMKAANALLKNSQADFNKSPWDPTKPPPMSLAVGGYVDLRNHMVLLGKLESRLQKETLNCGLCREKQEELSELLRQELLWEPLYKMAGLRTYDPISDRLASMQRSRLESQGVVGLPPTLEGTRWSNPQIALEEAADIYKRHCALPLPSDSTPEMRREKVFCEADAMVGDRGGSPRLRELAKGHEAAWSSCFQANDWIASASARRAYEACMDAKDPLSQMCESDRKALGGKRSTACPGSFVVTVVDVDPLRNYTDRWPAEPSQASPARAVNLVNVSVPSGTPYSVTLLEPITTAYANVTSRGYKARLNETLSSVNGMALIPAGSEVTMGVAMRSPKGVLTIFVYARETVAGDGPFHLTSLQSTPITIEPKAVDPRVALFPTGAVLRFVADRDIHVSVDSARLGTATPVTQGRGKKAATGTVATSGSPTGSTPSAPVGGVEVASTQASSVQPMESSANTGLVGQARAGNVATLTLRQNTRVPVLFSDAVSANGIHSGALLHGKLLSNLTLKGPGNPFIPAQTDVYVRVDNAEPSGADLTIDHLPLAGQDVVIPTSAIHQTVKTAPSVASRQTTGSPFHIGGTTIPLPSMRGANSSSPQGLLINKNAELIFLVNKDVTVPNSLSK